MFEQTIRILRREIRNMSDNINLGFHVKRVKKDIEELEQAIEVLEKAGEK